MRLHNSSQLAAFSKQDDLAYFLRVICSASYRHEPLLAPTQPMLDHYRKEKGGWAEYERQFRALLAERQIETQFSPQLFEPTSVLLCSEATADHCHRRLVLEYLQEHWGNLRIIHL